MVLKISNDSKGIANEIKTIISMNKRKLCKNVPSLIHYDMILLKNFKDDDEKK